MNITNRFLAIFIVSINLVYAQEHYPTMEEFGKIYEKFYRDLGEGNLDSIRAMIIPISGDLQSISGAALFRNSAGPFSVSRITQIANANNINKPFKRSIGCDVVLYQYLAVRYKYPADVEQKLMSKRVRPYSKWAELEEVFCDLWIFGSDGKWRVACDYFPGAALDCQTLGIKFMKNSKQAESDQSRIAEIIKNRYAAVTGD